MSTASRVVPERDGFRGCHADASLQLSTRGERLRRAKDVGTNVGSNAPWWLLTDRERARETRDRGPLLFSASATIPRTDEHACLPRPPRRDRAVFRGSFRRRDRRESLRRRPRAGAAARPTAGRRSARCRVRQPDDADDGHGPAHRGAARLEVTPIDGLREIAHGRWERKTRAEVEQEFPEEYARYETDPYSFAPTEGESGLSVTARALPALLKIVEEHPDQRILDRLAQSDDPAACSVP